MEFKDRFRKLIDELDIPRNELAELCGISKSQLYNYLNGVNEPTSKLLRELKKNFPFANIDWLVTGLGDFIKQTPGVRYKDLREILELTYDGKYKEKVVNLMGKENFTTLEKLIFLYTIMTFLNKASEKDSYYDLLYRWATLINKDNVGSECEESKALIMSNLTDADRLFEIAQFGFEYDQPGLVFYFTQLFAFLEEWDYEPQTMKVKIKLFNETFVTYDPFGHKDVKEQNEKKK